jgi:hypothetical protein
MARKATRVYRAYDEDEFFAEPTHGDASTTAVLDHEDELVPAVAVPDWPAAEATGDRRTTRRYTSPGLLVALIAGAAVVFIVSVNLVGASPKTSARANKDIPRAASRTKHTPPRPRVSSAPPDAAPPAPQHKRRIRSTSRPKHTRRGSSRRHRRHSSPPRRHRTPAAHRHQSSPPSPPTSPHPVSRTPTSSPPAPAPSAPRPSDSAPATQPSSEFTHQSNSANPSSSAPQEFGGLG